MNTAIATRVAAGVTAAYLRELAGPTLRAREQLELERAAARRRLIRGAHEGRRHSRSSRAAGTASRPGRG